MKITGASFPRRDSRPPAPGAEREARSGPHQQPGGKLRHSKAMGGSMGGFGVSQSTPHAWFSPSQEGFGVKQRRFCPCRGDQRLIPPRMVLRGPAWMRPHPGASQAPAGHSPAMRWRHMMVLKYFPFPPGWRGPGSGARAKGPEATGWGCRKG